MKVKFRHQKTKTFTPLSILNMIKGESDYLKLIEFKENVSECCRFILWTHIFFDDRDKKYYKCFAEVPIVEFANYLHYDWLDRLDEVECVEVKPVKRMYINYEDA